MIEVDAALIERLAIISHNAYEVAAANAGWQTQKASRKPWAEVPEPNRITVRTSVRAMLNELREIERYSAPPVRRFKLERREDETGVSGTGVVAYGIEFADGVVALRWTSAWPTSVVFHDRGMESVEAVHGHNGKTRVVYLDD